MTRSHAKNSHSSPFFTSHERSILPYGSKKQRIGAESFRKFDACMLCNSTVRDPVACHEGHIFCRECILESLLSQKKLIKAHQVAVEKRSGEEEEERNRARSEARERVLKDFERTQSALGGGSAKEEGGGGREGRVEEGASEKEGEEARGLKRKFGFDLDAVTKLAEEAEDAAMAKIEKEQAEARKAKLPAFWLPSLTPVASGPAPIAAMKLETMCHADKHPHPLSIKKLIPVHFTPLPTPSNSTAPPPNVSTPVPSICPSCSKELTNGSTAVLNKTCGHVVCKSCCDKIVKPSKQCVVCDGRAKEKDLVELKRDGTGFAAAGGAESKKSATAFQ